ncbi:reverse transcriptase [Arenimonas caeni]|uniref:Reverse transcriptase n=1 Tax=Arenimonas caeni TaxID=2058085 RepID=A0A2P6MA19_9GAMM|nr:reverse transcriptase [Arenimonas caeni]
MTKPRYASTGCAARSQVSGDTDSPCAWRAGASWCVDFNNGNVNNNDHDNRCFVRAVRSASPAPGEFQGPGGREVSLRSLHAAWQEARRGKQPSVNQLRFDAQWIDGLLQLQAELSAAAWSPRPSTCFIAARPKAREIHAPDFADRVVHHWLVPQLEAIYEPTFIHDSFANRRGKGTHAAVRRLQQFVRQVHSGQGGGWYLQLDVHNFFNSIHRPTLWQLLKRRIVRNGLPPVVQATTHALLRRSPLAAGVTYRASTAERAAVPPHKQLENAAPGCGLPIGNLSSQFFANVYLDQLDQFVKHVLKAPRYLRYVDDFVLVHQDRVQLADWQARIERFLADHLQLRLKADVRLKPLEAGIDFLGYVVRPTHTLVRRRVVSHARAALAAWEQRHVQPGCVVATPAELRHVGAVWASYRGHMAQANSRRLQARLRRRFPWLATVAEPPLNPALVLEGQKLHILTREIKHEQ